MKNRLLSIWQIVRRFLWACIVAYMIAWHNFYYQDERLTEETENKIIHFEEDEDGSDY